MRQFFAENATIITFAHGLAFFALGFAVWLQRRRTTRLTLSAGLIWLATFAFVESIAIWGYVFVPIQRTYLDHAFLNVLIGIRAVVQVAAFVFLLEFGLRLAPLGVGLRRSLTGAAILVSVCALGGFAAVAQGVGWTIEEWERSAVAACRYGVLLPGAALAALGFWRHGSELVSSGMKGIKPYADAAGWVMVAYAILAGLLVDAAPWAPPGLLSEGGWLPVAGFPLAALRALAGLALCALAIKLLEIFEVETQQQLQTLRRARLVAEERSRFGRDLHDGTIQSIYAAGLQLEAIAMRAEDASAASGIRAAVQGLNGTIAGIRGYIDGLHESPAAPETLALALRDQAHRYSAETGMEVAVRVTGVNDSGPLPAEIGHHAEQILREALSNAARHGRSRTPGSRSPSRRTSCASSSPTTGWASPTRSPSARAAACATCASEPVGSGGASSSARASRVARRSPWRCRWTPIPTRSRRPRSTRTHSRRSIPGPPA